MNLIAIETATEACSAALWIDGGCEERYEVAPRRHAQLILPMIEDLLRSAGLARGDIDALAFGRGPGAFTGLRIAAGVVQGLAFGLDVPVAPVSSLAALAGVAHAGGQRRVLALLDARMNEVYAGAFLVDAPGRVSAASEEVVAAAADVRIPDGDDWFAAGPGWSAYEGRFSDALAGRIGGHDGDLLPRAGVVAAIGAAMMTEGEYVAPEQAIPVYLRDRVAEKPGR